jgi:ADP-ribosyl-[dinitrogen reductase] hydrolase
MVDSQPAFPQLPITHGQVVFSSPEVQRMLGLVVGAAVGDALGAPFEFGPSRQYSRRFPRPVLAGTGEMIGGGSFGWAPGEFTDDTQMALALAVSLLDAGRYEPDSLWQAWRKWAADAADVGTTTRASLRFADWRSVHHPDPARTAANGALMRAFPLAVAFIGSSDDEARAVVLHQAALTHPHPAAGWGAWLAVAMMRAGIRGGDPFAALARELNELPGDVAGTFRAVLTPGWTPDRSHPHNGTVWGCLAHAVWAVRSTDSFEAAVIAAIELGGDTDTVACVAGAIAGALYGVQAIPSRWATYVHGRVTLPGGERRFGLADLQHLALALAGREVRPEAPGERPAGPLEVAPGLYAANLLGAAAAPADWSVVSLCRTGEMFGQHRVRRQVYLVDKPGEHNAALAAAVDDAVAAVEALLAEGHKVVVHCHGGRSRTGLVLKAWKMRTDGCSEPEAHAWLEAQWPLVQRLNPTFTDFLRSAR